MTVKRYRYFNSHAHVERDLRPYIGNSTTRISTHTLTWSVTTTSWWSCLYFCISTHTLTWSVTTSCFWWDYFYRFQLTRSRGAWRQFSEIVYIITYFNSHAHVERDMLSGHFKTLPIISTHTLTWSVTVRPVINPVSNWISTHTLTWSVTRRSKTKEVKNMISTHTLTWSVTVRHAIESREEWFQLTRSRGAWPLSDYTPLCDFIFQLTRSRGAWLVFNRPPEFTVNFNSHAHVERDRWLQAPERLFGISTHTLTWSVTAVHGP